MSAAVVESGEVSTIGAADVDLSAQQGADKSQQTEAAGQASSRQERVEKCYKLGDTHSLVRHHNEIDLEKAGEHNEENPGVGGDYIKSFVFGGLDGIVSTFALVAGLGGADVNITTLLAVGLAKVIADAFSMGFGEFTSATAELEHALRVKAREEWETENYEEGEVKEMCEIYMNKGCKKEDALTMMTVMAQYKELFIEHMMVMEHGIMMPDDADKWAPMKQGIVCFLAFIAFGFVPLFGFLVLYAVQGAGSKAGMGWTLVIAYGLTALTLFIMGVVKARLTGQPQFLRSGIMMVVNGTIAGGVAYLIGETLAAVF